MDEQTLIENLKEAGRFYPYADHVFLVDGDAFALSADRLERIAGLIQLKKLGINDLYVGIESGLDDVLVDVRKGHTVNDAVIQLNRLNHAGIRHCMMLMPGLAGKGRGIESGIAAAKLANQTNPFLIIPTTLGVFEGTELFAKMQSGKFEEAGEKESD